MSLIRTGLIVALFAGPFLAPREAGAQGAFEGWHLEPGVAQAHLVMLARVASVGQLRVVEGAKTDVALREYRFQPVRRLKGIFQRDELAMTGGDLGLISEDASQPAPLQEGEFRLLILVQQQGLESMGCVSASPGATTFDERVPRLSGPDDPLVTVVDTLIRVTDSRSRRERARLLIDGLMQAEGIAAAPLLSSLRLRADWAATDPRAYAALARLARDPQLAVRRAALDTLRDMLASGARPQDPQLLEPVADALRQVFETKEAITQLRVTALEALGHLLAMGPSNDWSRELLITELTGAATYAERGAAVTALAQLNDPAAAPAALEALGKLPLDELPAREAVYANSALQLDSPGAQRALLTRLERSIAARQSLAGEIEPLGRTRNRECLPLLLAAANLATLAYDDRRDIAWALGRLGDDRSVPVLMSWLRGDDYHLKERALAALETLDSDLAGSEVRTLLKSEPHLPFKLRMARLMARHGIADGYALATEHLADVGRTPEAALVLAALDDPRAAPELSAIMTARPDRRWLAAALAGLTAIGDASGRKQVAEILSDDRHPLVAEAAEAAGLAEGNELLLPLTRLAKSRNSRLALTSLVALRRSMLGVRGAPRGLAAAEQMVEANVSQPAAEIPTESRAAVSEALASLMVDAYVAADVRNEAFAVAKLLGGPRYVEVLSTVADQAELEGTQLRFNVEAELRRRRRTP
ncbi:MAG: hypothetical protein SGJ19_01370 [Planctomycetia bacterium]|nr:hypothetical protein [Planctomycetia bacterium]